LQAAAAANGLRLAMRCHFSSARWGDGRAWRQAITALILFCGWLFAGRIEAQVNPIRRVLVFYEVGPHYPAIALIDKGISDVFRNSPYQIELYREYLDTALFPDPAIQLEFREWYTRKYRDRRPDIIIVVGPSALGFMIAAHEAFFRDVPVVFCLSSEEAAGHAKLESHFTGMWEEPEPTKTLEAALRLKPGTKHVFLVGGTSPYDRSIEALFREGLHNYESRLDFKYLTDLAMPQLLDRLRHLPDHSVVLHLGMLRDAAGKQFIDATEAGPMVVQAANAPVFTFSDLNLGHGEAGGNVFNLADEGTVAAATALRILRGEKPQDIPIVRTVNIYMFDWRALKRWGMKESALPPGSIILNRQPTIWESYKAYIIGGISLLLVESLLIFGLVWQRGRAKRAEVQLRESEQRFRRVANTAPVMIWMSATNGKYSYVNKTWLDFTGRSLEAEIGDNWAGGLHPEDSGRCLRTYTESFDRRESFELQYRLRRHDGEYRWVLDKGVPRFDPNGTFAGYIGSCIDFTDRKLAEEGLATIGRRLIEAHEAERTWIGRELHDDINQRLALLAIELDRWSQDASTNEVTELVRHTRARITEIAQDVQGLSHRLHSSKLDYLGLATAAKSFCRELSEKTKVEIVFEHAGIPHTLSKEVSLCLFRVLQEGLQNAVKHSGVRTFIVDLQGTEESIELTVEDFGNGFEEQEACTRHGLGLISMRERLHLVHGELSVKSQPGAGTTIRARVPLKTDEYRAMAG
jgi:PAS domain S-box-containing protein